jgi:hypothetical protein
MAQKTDRITGHEIGFLGECIQKNNKMCGNLLKEVSVQRIFDIPLWTGRSHVGKEGCEVGTQNLRLLNF